MSLFVGNISKRVTVPQFEQAFRNFGRCRVDLRVCHPTSEKKFAFVQYDNEKEAEAAKNQLHNTDFCGLKLNVEWAKNSGRFQENNNRNRRDYGGGGGRRRSASRERSWDRHKRYRSISRERRRESPDYSQDLDVDPQCPRDLILLSKLQEKREHQRQRREQHEKQRQRENDKERAHENKDKQAAVAMQVQQVKPEIEQEAV